MASLSMPFNEWTPVPEFGVEVFLTTDRFGLSLHMRKDEKQWTEEKALAMKPEGVIAEDFPEVSATQPTPSPRPPHHVNVELPDYFVDPEVPLTPPQIKHIDPPEFQEKRSNG